MRSMKQVLFQKLVIPGIALYALCLPVNMAQAAPITFNFSGFVSDVADPLSPPISALGQQVQGSFTVDFTPKTGGTYNGVVTGFAINFNGTPYSANFASGLTNGVQIHNAVGNGQDKWSIGTNVSGTSINGLNPDAFFLTLKGKDMFSSDDLQPPNLSAALQSAKWRLSFLDGDDDVANIKGVITQLTAVPLPAAVVLFGAGLISLVGLGAGGLRNLRRTQA